MKEYVKTVYDPLIDKNASDLSQYTHIRAYHACRPLNIDDYLADGIICRTKEELRLEAVERLKTLNVTKETISSAFDMAWNCYHQQDSGDNEVVYLNAWKDELIGYSAHYLIYGSELINSTAVKLASSEWESNQFRDELKRTGRPTIIICDIPLEDIQEPYRSSLSECLPIRGDTTISVKKVNPENIVDLEYPTDLPDVYHYGKLYKYQELSS